MAAPRQFTDSEMAEHLRGLAQVSAEPDKRRFFHLARMCDLQVQLVDGSRRRIAESRLLLAELKKYLP